MPFKKFPGDDGEAQDFSVSFGPPAASLSNGSVSKQFKKAAEADSKEDEAFMPRPNSADTSGRNTKTKMPLMAPAAARSSSPLRTPSVTNGRPLSSPLSFSSNAHDQAVQTEPTLSPLKHSPVNTGRLPQKSSAMNHNDDLSKSSAKLFRQGENENPVRATGLVQLLPPSAPQNVPNTQIVRGTSGTREPRARHSSPQESASRFFSSALQQLKATKDGSAVSLSAEQQRDEIARGRRLRRFNDPNAKIQSETQGTVDQVTTKRAKGGSKPVMMETRDDTQDNLTESEAPDGMAERDWQSTEPILGNCPDMCPESERLERERKGDLDKLERLDGDRNQTSKDLAVKKYTRTAEKHALLIRPISVLLRTMKHLLHLLNRGYDEELLNLHNFLWDRMRAVRMDLRMQHIFNEQAVVMHEQMIRFHILAMHELCEYAKGEGFSEGFDAHLNIEQMNKASVDLFHMYDDLRKSGHSCPCEPEFRGYYALLKLDKHPGYVVEPVELSLDLAKMTPEMRNTQEVQFARKVARACRSGNYLAFFRLARDATYLQACLMHAHFSKLRSQAMAFLYSGLQRNQGIPIVQVEDWLGMEGEDIESLLEYHGFSVKNFEEPYMVKDGPYLNQNQAFQTRRSKLVEEKRSHIVEDDVLSSGQEKLSTAPALERISSLRRQSESQPPTQLPVADEEMPDYEEDEQPPGTSLDHPQLSPWQVFPWQEGEGPSNLEKPEVLVPAPVLLTPDVPIRNSMQESSTVRKSEQDDNEWFQVGKRRKSPSPLMEISEYGPTPDEHVTTSRDKKLRAFEGPRATSSPQLAVSAEVKTRLLDADHHEEEMRKQKALKADVNLSKVRILLRKWRARAALKAEERQWRQQKLETALSSFHVGLPVQDDEKIFPKDSIVNSWSANAMELDLLQIEDKRSEKIERMWTELDVMDVVAPILKQKNPGSKFLCWKLVMCSHAFSSDASVLQGRHEKSGDWLLAKILHQVPFDRTNSKGLFFTDTSQDCVTVASQNSETKTPSFYIARDLQFRHGEIQAQEAGRGASGILFLVSESASLDDEGRRLHALVNTLPNGAKLPLLVLYSTLSNFNGAGASIPHNSLDATALANLLGMDELNKGKVAWWSVLPILESHEPSCWMGSLKEEGVCSSKSKGFYSEDLLKNGLCWLALRAPIQPNLRCVNIQNLVMEHLQPFFNHLSTMGPAHVTPNMCVEAFNEALLKTANDVNNAATSCHLHWPPDELTKAFEKRIGERVLSVPSLGWNEASYLRPIIEALSLCRLPKFSLASVTVQNLETSVSLRSQKATLEGVLHAYVNQICGSSHADPLTLQAVDGILQKSCVFKQTSVGRSLIPNWSLIFQQLYHIRLALLSSDPPAVVWVQIREGGAADIDTMMSPHFSECLGPTLNEMIELEEQEAFLRKNLDAIHLSTGDQGSINMELKEQTVIAGLEEFRQANAEALQESTCVIRATPEISEVMALPTEGELELEKMVNKFCEMVDQQATEAANLEAGEALSIQSIGGIQIERSAKSNMSVVSSVNDAGLYTDASHLLAGSNGFGSLAQLLQHCEAVQNSIDRTLRECFQIGGPT